MMDIQLQLHKIPSQYFKCVVISADIGLVSSKTVKMVKR